jgi:hypothetical protein
MAKLFASHEIDFLLCGDFIVALSGSVAHLRTTTDAAVAALACKYTTKYTARTVPVWYGQRGGNQRDMGVAFKNHRSAVLRSMAHMSR